MPGINESLAEAFDEIADLLELRGQERFRITSYRRAADSIRAASRDVAELDASQLTDLRGVGEGTAAKIAEFVTTGRIGTLDELRAGVPAGVRAFTGLPGLGPKRAMTVYQELGISTVPELRDAAKQGKLQELSGFGEKVEARILRAIERGERGKQAVLLGRALPMAESIVADLRSSDVVVDAAYAGSVRRMRETIGDLDVLAASHDPDVVMDAFTSIGGVRSTEAEGQTKASVLTSGGLQVDLRVVEPDVFGAALQYFTGSKAHNVKVREHAVRRGLKLSEYGLFRDEARLAAATEHDVYEALGMQWVPPAMREDRGEVEAALRGELPSIVELSDMRGDLQSHSTYSDGRVPVREMALGAQALGYEYYAITDHGRWLRMRSLSLEDIETQRAEVAAIDAELDITVLHGVELNISKDGRLDYDDDVLASFDVCVASIHSHFDLSRTAQTDRVLRALANPHVHVFGHPTARRIGHREASDIDIGAVARACAEHGVALEINAHPHRLDLKDDHVRWAKEHGVRFALSTDAHSVAELSNMRYGIGTAQRAWVTPDEVINTWPLERLRAFLRKERI